jgi:hypothetical protein
MRKGHAVKGRPSFRSPGVKDQGGEVDAGRQVSAQLVVTFRITPKQSGPGPAPRAVILIRNGAHQRPQASRTGFKQSSAKRPGVPPRPPGLRCVAVSGRLALRCRSRPDVACGRRCAPLLGLHSQAGAHDVSRLLGPSHAGVCGGAQSCRFVCSSDEAPHQHAARWRPHASAGVVMCRPVGHHLRLPLGARPAYREGIPRVLGDTGRRAPDLGTPQAVWRVRRSAGSRGLDRGAFPRLAADRRISMNPVL